MRKKVNTDNDCKFIGWFLKPTLEEHLKNIGIKELGDISENAFKYIKELTINNLRLNELIDFAIDYFGSSNNCNSAIKRHNRIVLNISDDMNLEQMKHLLHSANGIQPTNYILSTDFCALSFAQNIKL